MGGKKPSKPTRVGKVLPYLRPPHLEVVAQLVRASDCGSEGRGFDPHLPPLIISKNRLD